MEKTKVVLALILTKCKVVTQSFSHGVTTTKAVGARCRLKKSSKNSFLAEESQLRGADRFNFMWSGTQRLHHTGRSHLHLWEQF